MMYQPNFNIQKVYIQRMEDNRGVIELDSYYTITTLGLQKYLLQKQRKLIQIATKHE